MVDVPRAELLSVDLLKSDGKNPNQMTKPVEKALMENIRRFGFLIPVITNKDFIIADGEHRLAAGKALGMTEVPVIALPVSEVDRKILRQVMNKLRGEHDFDLDMLEFKDIFTMGGEEDLQLLLALKDKEFQAVKDYIREVPTDSDNVPEVVESRVQPGDLWVLGRHRLLCADATKPEDVSQLTGEEKAMLLLTDPPYGISIVNAGAETPTAPAFGKVGRRGVVHAGNYEPIMNDDTPFDPRPYLCLAEKVILFGANHYASRLPDNSHWLVWDKKAEVGADKNSFSDVELMWTNILRKNAVIYRFLWSGLLRSGSRDEELLKRVHPTQKPVGLLKNIINDYTEEGDIVLDLFGGSGSTLIACENNNRSCRMIELSPSYCDVIITRWEQLTNKTAVKQS